MSLALLYMCLIWDMHVYILIYGRNQHVLSVTILVVKGLINVCGTIWSCFLQGFVDLLFGLFNLCVECSQCMSKADIHVYRYCSSERALELIQFRGKM